MSSVAIMWFRRDLRLADNPALVEAASHDRLLPIWIDETLDAGTQAAGSAVRVWQHHGLDALNAALGGHLALYNGPAKEVFAGLLARFDIKAVYWNRCYEPWRIARDAALKEWLKAQGIITQSSNGSLLWEPWEINKADGTPYKVFTPYYRKGCLVALAPRPPLAAPNTIHCIKDQRAQSLSQLNLLPKRPWATAMMQHWKTGEQGAAAQLEAFLEQGLGDYKTGRDFPSKLNVSRLSPYLQGGELSPNQIWYAVRDRALDMNVDHFCSELGWREFSYSQLYHNPDFHRQNLQAKFDSFPWRNAPEDLHAWQRGQTGIPMVDAGMRELWQTGYMHNRVRMVAASFLVKNLLIDWRHGEAWFRDTLVDADPASNVASWQWVAGCGADAAPYFRIFNPATQGKKFDPTGAYIRKWIPELRTFPDKFLFAPWEAEGHASADMFANSEYPAPIVNLKQSRERALAAFKRLG